MTTASHDVRGRASSPHFGVVAVLVVVGSLVLGALTSVGQSPLPAVLAPFANSVSGWTLLTASLLWLVRRPVGSRR